MHIGNVEGGSVIDNLRVWKSKKSEEMFLAFSIAQSYLRKITYI